MLGNGTTTTNHQYTFLDDSALKSGFRYYRLKQFDIDGDFTYSDIRSVDFGTFSGVAIFPNPFVGEINIMNLPEKGILQNIEIINTLGQLIFESSQTEDVKDLVLEVDKKLAAGTYFLSIHTDQEILTFPIIKKEE